MPNIWRIANLTIISAELLICSLGTFYKHIAFGWGLGDLLWYGLMYLLLIVHIILTIAGKNKTTAKFRTLTIIFATTTVLICLQATIWRGTEYRWNGHLFYDN